MSWHDAECVSALMIKTKVVTGVANPRRRSSYFVEPGT
jgi:hypothetical protein